MPKGSAAAPSTLQTSTPGKGAGRRTHVARKAVTAPARTGTAKAERAAQAAEMRDLHSLVSAIRRSQAVVEFTLDGDVTYANDNFLAAMGYGLNDVLGKHHRMFVDSDYARTEEYDAFWRRLRGGHFFAEECKRIGRGGREVWMQASYHPMFDESGKPCRVVQFAADVTAQVKFRVDAKLAEERDREQARLFLSSMHQTALAVAASSEQLTNISQRLTANSQDVALKAQDAAKVSDDVSNNVSVVSTSANEMLVSIREISRSSAEAARVARTAVTMASDTNDTISKLGEASQEIGKVVKVITSIAQQTNLLALNATIEAARAGEAGKGFAVVANEVKELAKETARATEEISQKIEAIQGNTVAAIRAIGEVSGIINQVNDISGTIASAVEEQTATTNEIGQNVASAASGTRAITQNITRVAKGTEDAALSARDTQEAALGLARMAAEMQGLVARFQL